MKRRETRFAAPTDEAARAHWAVRYTEFSRMKPHRSFDPLLVARLECAAWVAYYRHNWIAFMRAVLAGSRAVFGLPWTLTILCSWFVMRATQLWAPFPGNDPERARRRMERFYRILQRHSGESFNPAHAAALELAWWSVHRDNQHAPGGGDDRSLIDALTRLYAHVYGVPERSVRPAAEQRALAMRHSDQWVREGRDPRSPLIDRERTALVRSYTALLAAVH